MLLLLLLRGKFREAENSCARADEATSTGVHSSCVESCTVITSSRSRVPASWLYRSETWVDSLLHSTGLRYCIG